MDSSLERGLIVPIIMAGGSGTRLWPVSRASMPKQFAQILDGNLSMFQSTLLRVSGPEFGPPIVVTGQDFRFIAAVQMQAIGVAGEIILEPTRRDSAAAVAAGTIQAAKRNPNSVCLAMPADQLVINERDFVTDCLKAARAARAGCIAMLGTRAERASTEYGYIEVGEPLGEEGVYRLNAFVEKPDRDCAQSCLERGLLWNSGNLVFSGETMIDELKAHAPQVLTAASNAVERARRDLDFLRLNAEAFGDAPRISIDYAVMEKTRRAGVVKAAFGWTDVGSWDSIYAIKSTDAEGNVLEGDVSVLDTSDSLVLSRGLLTAVVGLENVMVVSTPDAVLIASRHQAPRVKDLVGKLIADGRIEAMQHARIQRPWGWYKRIDVGPRFQVKHICVHPGGTLSLQKHHHRAEHWVVIHGTAEVTIDGEVTYCHENESAFLPTGCVHRLHNPGRIDLTIIEVQIGAYTEEDDIVRFEDLYARA